MSKTVNERVNGFYVRNRAARNAMSEIVVMSKLLKQASDAGDIHVVRHLSSSIEDCVEKYKREISA